MRGQSYISAIVKSFHLPLGYYMYIRLWPAGKLALVAHHTTRLLPRIPIVSSIHAFYLYTVSLPLSRSATAQQQQQQLHGSFYDHPSHAIRDCLRCFGGGNRLRWVLPNLPIAEAGLIHESDRKGRGPLTVVS